ncbi:hypothetical protein [Bizionia myxarmorum]|uniref:Uncharacterized protein n=1 Tax=Bizionia myxarmorum TaxID=291186 RepID=A0A5D0R2Q3_9FLAO|nr:hypothetical protein [Bizionia myxarmorum]TYB75860.1 hypothetical protein ES674_13650 [Bizionia myxarmorum]
MIKIAQKGILLLSIISIISCGTNKISTENTKVNTAPNSKYKNTIKAYSGTLSISEYKELIKKLEIELKTAIPENTSILVNFNQKAPNCIAVGLSEGTNHQVIINRLRISERMSSDNNAVDFFVYTKDAYLNEAYQVNPAFTLDSGFFYNEVFPEHQNCAGFLIIKPNGAFYKYYGEDYFTEVKKFLEKIE